MPTPQRSLRRASQTSRSVSRRPTPLANRKVVALAYDGLATFEFAIVVEVFGLSRPEMGPGWYQFAVASADRPPLRATGGIRVMVDGGLELLEDAGTIVLPGWRGIESPIGPKLQRILRAAHARGARILTVCSGSFALAQTGLLDGKRATTHWRYIQRFRDLFPRVRVEDDVLYVDDGSLFTSAGSAAGIDLCLHLVRRDFGARAANMVARRMVVPPHRDGGQLQYVEQPVPAAHEGDRLSPLIESLRRRLNRPLSVPQLAREARMSERTFARRFTASTGLPPGKWLNQERVRHAQQLLETRSLSVESTATECGFADASSLWRHFRAQVGVSPAAYRSRFARPVRAAR
jgi:AraC family transcriptional activator FtrA